MAYSEVTMLEIKEFLRLWLEGQPKKRIAMLTGRDVKTVRSYVTAALACGLLRDSGPEALTAELLAAVAAKVQPRVGRPRGSSWETCEAQREFIRGSVDDGVRLTKVRKLLRRRGVHVSQSTLWRFAVAELGFGKQALTIPVADCEPGQEVQLDTGWVGRLAPDARGKQRRFRAFIFTAVRSRHRFVYPSFRETTADTIEACEAAWAFYGGVFKVLIVDNLKAVVQDADALHPRLNMTFLEYAQARGSVIDTARVRKPRDKARVERAVQTVRDDCFAGERLIDLAAARQHAEQWCREEYGLRRHTRTQRLPLEHFEAEERAALLPAPSQAYDVPLWSKPKVARDQHAQVAKALYSLPTCYVGRRLRARADRNLVHFYDGAQVVKTHPRQPPGGRSTDRNDFPPEKSAYALRDVGYFIALADKHGPAVGAFAKALLDTDLPWTRMRQVYALVGLARRYGSARTNAACQTALGADLLNVYRLRRILEVAATAPEPSSAKVVPIARYLRPATQYALPFVHDARDKKGEHA